MRDVKTGESEKRLVSVILGKHLLPGVCGSDKDLLLPNRRNFYVEDQPISTVCVAAVVAVESTAILADFGQSPIFGMGGSLRELWEFTSKTCSASSRPIFHQLLIKKPTEIK